MYLKYKKYKKYKKYGGNGAKEIKYMDMEEKPKTENIRIYKI